MRNGGLGMNTRKDDKNTDENVMRAIKEIIQRGNDAEVRREKDGSVKVFEVKKHIVKIE